ncbi:MAG TPA: GTPase ObgE [Planctomycetota bacterium]|nr:GTPase ObgE [Planctomycetota bacterium]
MFRDEARIEVKAGDGGKGCLSFRREKCVPLGGPDGGDGGKGGDVVLEATSAENTLLDVARSPRYRAAPGEAGRGRNCAGANAADLVLKVPVGTVVKDALTGATLADLAKDGDRFLAAKGGQGGRGNAAFKHALNQAPRQFEPGRRGQLRKLQLELKLIADVGLAGLPNAGKSTLVSRVSRATPKIADYPFTTLEPHPGIVELPGYRRFVIMDIPGLIEGAAEGHGLGHRFLRHIERTRVIVHVVDLFPAEKAPSPAEAYRVIEGELKAYSPTLYAKPRLVAFNKADQDPEAAAERARALERELGVRGHVISGATGQGLPELMEACWVEIARARAAGG